MDYLTQEDFETAKANGISYGTAYARFYEYMWSKEDTINTPVMKSNVWGEWKEVAAKHGVAQSCFYQRMKNNGMTPEEAATTPRKPNRYYGKHSVKITPEVMAQAKANGISRSTLTTRVYTYKWSVEKAMNTPVKSQYRRKDYEAART